MIQISQLKRFAASKKSIVRVFGKLDVHFFSLNPAGEIDSPVIEIVSEEKLPEFLSDALQHAELFQIEGRFWKRELNRLEMERALGEPIAETEGEATRHS